MTEANITGLDDDAVRARIQDGRVNDIAVSTSRSVWDIARTNILTPFNALLGSLFAIIVVIGPIQDALFGGVLVANATIGIAQELRAKRALDRLTVLTSPIAHVVRGGATSDIAVNELVVDDVMELRPGDQIAVDGAVLASEGLEIDESLLTGESDAVTKSVDDEVLSGSYVIAGTGLFRATRVGQAAYARSLTDQARQFSLARSELRTGINRIVVLVSWALIPTAVLLFASQLRTLGLEDSLRAGVAGTVAMVPEGLVLLMSIAFAVAVVRLGRVGVLVQDLPAVEGLARTDVLCIDKTGTLTEGRHVVNEVQILDRAFDAIGALGALGAAESTPNASMRAIATSYPGPTEGWNVVATVPFSSARKWSAASFVEQGGWVLGAADVVLANTLTLGLLQDEIQTRTARGLRVLVLAHSGEAVINASLPSKIRPVALVSLTDKVRADASSTLGYFADEGVEIKVISGDDPRTVTAVAEQAGMRILGPAVDGRTLPDDATSLAEVTEANDLFGRVSPSQKRAMVAALQSRGHVVAMTGDGVNDIPALKQADLGVAMGTGSSATRAASQLVLLPSSFAVLPSVVAEGRRVLANIERTATLFVTKTAYATVLALAVGVIGVPFPFLPRHLTLVGTLTIGIPAFFLALAPNDRRARPGFVTRVLRFAVPAGLITAMATLVAYLLIRNRTDVTLAQQRTTAVITLFWMGLLVLVLVASPLNHKRRGLIGALGGLFVVTLAITPLRNFFALSLPPPAEWLAALVVAALVAAGLRLAARRQRRVT